VGGGGREATDRGTEKLKLGKFKCKLGRKMWEIN
jgi:hypothetical protein